MWEIGPWRSLASALAWGARGPEFKSRRPDQKHQRVRMKINGYIGERCSESCRLGFPPSFLQFAFELFPRAFR